MATLKAIEETAYLSAPNVAQYRQIMRLFYREYERMHYRLYKEEVWALLPRDNMPAGYDMGRLEDDLAALVKWKNLVPIQDPGKVYTIAEYKNKQYRYSMSEAAVEIERMALRLETLYIEGANLSSSFFVRLERALQEAAQVSEAGEKEAEAWWSSLQEDFRRLNQSYKDYLRDFYSERAGALMKSMEFVIHKDKLIQYLNEFVQELQRYSRRIARLIEQNKPCIEEKLIPRAAAGIAAIPRTKSVLEPEQRRDIQTELLESWQSLQNWFIDRPEEESESRRVLRITNEIIRGIIQNAALLVQMQNWGMSRKEDYRRFLTLFLRCETLAEAHKLSAHVFGIQGIEHFKTRVAREMDDTSHGVYEEESALYTLKPRTRGYHEKKDRSGFADKTLEKLAQRQEYLREMQRQEEIVRRYIHNGTIVLSEIQEVVPAAVRSVFLQWISRANLTAEKKAMTEYGLHFRLRRDPGACVLRCDDGNLTMPAYRLEFEEKGGTSHE